MDDGSTSFGASFNVFVPMKMVFDLFGEKRRKKGGILFSENCWCFFWGGEGKGKRYVQKVWSQGGQVLFMIWAVLRPVFWS